MEEKSLKQLVHKIEHQMLGPDTLITDITNDSRKVLPGSAFIAISGYNTDGHLFIDKAVQAGAAAVVAQHPTPQLKIPQIIVEDTRRAQAMMAAEFFEHPSRSLQLVGVTGTNGKTTCTFMIDSILQAAGLATGLMGTLYNKVQGEILPTINTTPDSILCQSLLRNMVDTAVTHVSMEVSSHSTVMNRVDETCFSIGAITNFSPDHLDLHQNMEDYLQAKKRFFDTLSANAWAIVNLDSPDCLRIVSETPANRLTYSLSNQRADICLEQQRHLGSGSIITAKITSGKFPVSGEYLHFYLAVGGKHNIANALLAAATGLALGLDIPTVAKGLGTFRGIFRRYETIYNGDFRVIDDATHNPANMDAVFQAIYAEQPQGISIVYAIRGNRGTEINLSIAGTLRRWAERIKPQRLIITRCEDTASPLDQVRPDEEAVFRRVLKDLKTDLYFAATLRQAVDTALETMEKGKTLLLMGAHPMDNVASIFAQQAGVQVDIRPRPPQFGPH